MIKKYLKWYLGLGKFNKLTVLSFFISLLAFSGITILDHPLSDYFNKYKIEVNEIFYNNDSKATELEVTNTGKATLHNVTGLVNFSCFTPTKHNVSGTGRLRGLLGSQSTIRPDEPVRLRFEDPVSDMVFSSRNECGDAIMMFVDFKNVKTLDNTLFNYVTILPNQTEIDGIPTRIVSYKLIEPLTVKELLVTITTYSIKDNKIIVSEAATPAIFTSFYATTNLSDEHGVYERQYKYLRVNYTTYNISKGSINLRMSENASRVYELTRPKLCGGCHFILTFYSNEKEILTEMNTEVGIWSPYLEQLHKGNSVLEPLRFLQEDTNLLLTIPITKYQYPRCDNVEECYLVICKQILTSFPNETYCDSERMKTNYIDKGHFAISIDTPFIGGG